MSDSEPDEVLAGKPKDVEHQCKFVCPACDYISEKANTLKKHLKTEHSWSDSNVTELECCICSKIFPTTEKILIHEASTHQATVSRNPEQRPTSKAEKSVDFEERSEGWNFHCNKCGEVFRSQGHLDNHKNEFHPSRNLPCPISSCSARYSTEEHLQIHMSIDHPDQDKPFRCDLCGKGFQEEKHMKSHRLLHGFQCPACKIFFRAASGLYNHILFEHESEKVRWQCPLCTDENNFFRMSEFTEHCKISHPDVHPHWCKRCGEIFQNSEDLDNHFIKSHNGTEKRKCSEIEDPGDGNQSKTRRKERGKVWRPPPTSSSAQSPKTKSSKSGPEESSTPEKKYFSICKFCRGRFLGDEKSHKCSNGEGIFPCDVCHSKFNSKKNLYHHSITKHLRCIICSHAFGDERLANSHTSQKHYDFKR